MVGLYSSLQHKCNRSHGLRRCFHLRTALRTTPSRSPPSSASATRAPTARTASMAALEKTFALTLNSPARLPSRGSITRRIGPRAAPRKLHVSRTLLIWSCRMLFRPRKRLRNCTSLSVSTIRKLRSHARANPDMATATAQPVMSKECQLLPHTTSHGTHESPPNPIHAGRSALYRVFRGIFPWFSALICLCCCLLPRWPAVPLSPAPCLSQHQRRHAPPRLEDRCRLE